MTAYQILVAWTNECPDSVNCDLPDAAETTDDPSADPLSVAKLDWLASNSCLSSSSSLSSQWTVRLAEDGMTMSEFLFMVLEL